MKTEFNREFRDNFAKLPETVPGGFKTIFRYIPILVCIIVVSRIIIATG